MGEKKPPLYDMSKCFVCESPYVQWHHVYPSDRRQVSDREGCVIPLCYAHHQGRYGVHHERRLDILIKRDCQRRWMEREHATVDDFRKVFHANYLDGEQ